MNDEQPRTRSQEHTIEIDAPLEAVWKALTEGEELMRWYVQEAEVVPGKGGDIWVSFGEGMAGRSHIEVWEPGRHLRLSHLPAPGGGESKGAEGDQTGEGGEVGEGGEGGEVGEGGEGGEEGKRGAESETVGTPPLTSPIIEDYFLQSRGGVTVLRLVTSGIPDTPDWDGFYDGTNRGWELFLRTLRHYLEKHPGKPREHTVVMQPITGTIGHAWEELVGDEGLGLRTREVDLEDGVRYSARTAGGDELEGDVLMAAPPTALVLTLDNLDESIFAITFDRMGDQTFLYASLSSYGELTDDMNRLHTRWREWLKRLSSL